ncbi:Conserved_hypothetical protein [Hexamita inflata]|uniref:Uncharacterized protein n=1 Tax=Hexamita inflata TaxID=28002 RepID=A0AA86NNA0_9EUKA|nr:Conserved hypothetical protein [Hexamita inflata]
MMQNLNSAIDEFVSHISNSEQLIINKQQKQIKELYVDQQNIIRVQELLKNDKPEKLTFLNIENIPIIINSTVKEIVILKNAAVLKQSEYKSINIENTQFTSLKVLRFQTVLCFGQIDLSFVQKLVKFTQLQELSIDNHKCTISDLTHLQFLTTLQKLNMRNSGLTNLDILVPCSNLIECNIQDTINNNNQQCKLKDGNMYILNQQLMNIDVVQNIQINNLEIRSCPNIVTKFCSHSLKILSIIDCKLKQIDLKDLINLEVLILQDYQINQDSLNLQSITKLKKLQDIQISGYNVDIMPLQFCHNLINIQYNRCLNIDPQLICKSIKQLTITFCDINSINLQQFQELEELTLEDNYKYGDNKVQKIKLVTNLMHCSKLQKLNVGKCWQVDIIPLLITLTNIDARLPRIYNDIDYFKTLYNLNKLEQVKISERSLLIPQNDKLIVDDYQLNLLPFINIFDIQKLELHNCKNIPQFQSDLIKDISINSCMIQNMKLFHFKNLENLKISYQDGTYNGRFFKRYQSRHDMTILQQLKQLKYLTKIQLNTCQLIDIEFLGQLTNLKELNLKNNDIIYLDPLEKLTQLMELDVSYNQITDFTAIQEHPNFQIYYIDNQEKSSKIELKMAYRMRIINTPITLLNKINGQRRRLKQNISRMTQDTYERQREIINNSVYFSNTTAQIFSRLINVESLQ